MDEFTAETVTNRDERVPVVVADDDGKPPNSDEKKGRLKNAGSKLKGKLKKVVAGKSVSKHSLQDRLFTK
jgi:hypothetical protein